MYQTECYSLWFQQKYLYKRGIIIVSPNFIIYFLPYVVRKQKDVLNFTHTYTDRKASGFSAIVFLDEDEKIQRKGSSLFYKITLICVLYSIVYIYVVCGCSYFLITCSIFKYRTGFRMTYI